MGRIQSHTHTRTHAPRARAPPPPRAHTHTHRRLGQQALPWARRNLRVPLVRKSFFFSESHVIASLEITLQALLRCRVRLVELPLPQWLYCTIARSRAIAPARTHTIRTCARAHAHVHDTSDGSIRFYCHKTTMEHHINMFPPSYPAQVLALGSCAPFPPFAPQPPAPFGQSSRNATIQVVLGGSH